MKNLIKKTQQKLHTIWRKTKLHIFSFVGGQFKKRQTLTNKIREMILNFINNIQDCVLTTYHITIDFKTREKKPTFYRLELLAELRNDLESDILKSQIQHQIIQIFDLQNQSIKKVGSNYEKNRIKDDYCAEYKKYTLIKYLFMEWVKTFQETEPIGYKTIKVKDTSIPINGISDCRINILKSGQHAFSLIENMSCIEIETNKFKE